MENLTNFDNQKALIKELIEKNTEIKNLVIELKKTKNQIYKENLKIC